MGKAGATRTSGNRVLDSSSLEEEKLKRYFLSLPNEL
jgi:hypothetical protein